MKWHLVVVFLRGHLDSESAVKTTNGADIIIDKVDNEIRYGSGKIYSPCYSGVTLWPSAAAQRQLVAPATYSTSDSLARSYCDDIGYQTNSEWNAK